MNIFVQRIYSKNKLSVQFLNFILTKTYLI